MASSTSSALVRARCSRSACRIKGVALSRRRFCQWLGSTGVLAGAAVPSDADLLEQSAASGAETASHVGSLYSFIQKQADRSPLALSFLRPEFRDLEAWQKQARATVLDHLFYAPPPVPAAPE